MNLTVTDVDRSARWYGEVFGAVVMTDDSSVPPATSSPLRYRGLFDPNAMTYLIGLIEHPDGDRSRFDERRTGLDHFAVHVERQEDLEEWGRHLDSLGIEHSGIKRFDYEDCITLRDPDNIQLEICWPNIEFFAKRFAEGS